MNDNGPAKKFPVAHTDEYKQACKNNGDDKNGMMNTPAFVDAWSGLVYIEGQVGPKVAAPVCRACGGRGSFLGDVVPYGSTMTRLPDEMCEACYGLGIDIPEEVIKAIAGD